MTKAYLDIEDLNIVLYNKPEQRLLRDVSLHVESGEIRGLVGESGAGKSIIGRTILGILSPAMKILSGKVILDGEDVLRMKRNERKRFIAARTALIPQDPLTALNPSRCIGTQMIDHLSKQLSCQKAEAKRRVLSMLDEVRIDDPENILKKYPHELSGGMRQRVLIAAAFASEPKLIVADEPTTALDVTVQKQILILLTALRHGDTALLFVTHDLGVVAKLCQKVSVLFQGSVVEETDVKSLFKSPKHAYSKALINATPRYTDPDASLKPIDDKLLSSMLEHVAKADEKWKQSYGKN